MTATMRPTTSTCQWCGALFRVRCPFGTVPKYCRRSHRQRAYEYRRERGLEPEPHET